MNKTSIQKIANICLKIFALSGILMLITMSFVYAGGTGGGGGSTSGGAIVQNGEYKVDSQGSVAANRGAANTIARDFNQNPNQMPNGSVATVTSNRDGTVSVSIRPADRNGSSGGSVSGGTPTDPTTNCTVQPNLQTIDIFFVPAGTQPVTTRATSNVFNFLTQNPYQRSIISRNELEVGLSYEPVAVIRNVAACTPSNNGSSRDSLPQYGPRAWFSIPTVYAGGGSSASQPNDYPNYVRDQSPFGTGGSFPIRARIDVGNNTTFEWEHYINNFGPIGNSRTMYLKLPAFSTVEGGVHTIEVITDIRHNIDAGRGCFATTTPASAGWGCVRETRENDNDRREAFTTNTSSSSLRLAVDVSDVIVRASSTLTEVPFVAINTGRGTIDTYQYRIVIGATPFANATRTTSLTPTSRETVRGTGSFRTPTTLTSLPLMVCARVATSSEACDMARLIVTTPQCSDTRDNDGDGTKDATDPSCFTDPLDPGSYDPNDDNESDLASTSASVTIEFKPVVNPVRYNTGATLAYTINGLAPMNCVVTGGGTNANITHTPPRTTGQVTTAPVTSTQQYTLRCTATVGGSTLQFERTTTVDVLPLIQET